MPVHMVNTARTHTYFWAGGLLQRIWKLLSSRSRLQSPTHKIIACQYYCIFACAGYCLIACDCVGGCWGLACMWRLLHAYICVSHRRYSALCICVIVADQSFICLHMKRAPWFIDYARSKLMISKWLQHGFI